MRWTRKALRAVAMAAVVAGAGVTAPAARACDGDVHFGFEVRRPAVRVVTVARTPRLAWVAAHTENRIQRVILREGYWSERIEPATFGLRFDFGRRRFVRVEIRPATVVRTWVAPVVEERVVRVLVPGRWESRCD